MNIFFTIFGFIVGIVLGSFAKALADRSLADKTFLGRSKCPTCKKTLQWFDLFPVISYLLLQGKCRYCHKKISLEYFLVEVVMGILIAYLFGISWPNLSLDLILKTFFITILASLFLTDLKEMLIPDRIVLPAIIISFIFLVTTSIYRVGYLYYFLMQSLIGRLLLPPHSDYFVRHVLITITPNLLSILMALLIGGFFLSIIIITKGRGMGGGDVKLGALMGLGLGFPNSLIALMLAFIFGAVFSILLIILGKKHFGQSIAFGPFLVLGSLTALFWGDKIMDFYLHFSI